jgi:hypothetical protein
VCPHHNAFQEVDREDGAPLLLIESAIIRNQIMHHHILLNKQHLEPTYKHFHMLKKIKFLFNLYYYLHLTHGFMRKGILN